MSEITFGDVKMTVDGVSIDVSDVSLRPNKQPRRTFGNFEANFEVQMDAAQIRDFIGAFQPRGYWLRRQLHTRRKLWRQTARAFGLDYAEARELCRKGSVEVER